MYDFSEFLRRNRSRRLSISVLGDAMVDEYVDVRVNRISPEFPMPIMTSSSRDVICKPGGAANVAHQFRHLNVDPQLICLGDREAENVFSEHHLKCSGLLAGCYLPRKRRFLDNGIQVSRHDIELPLCGHTEEYIDHVPKILMSITDPTYGDTHPDVSIFSDYGKGFFASEEFHISDIFPGVTSIVDPKFGPLDKWVGCTIFKPNAKEAAELTGLCEWKDQARYLKEFLGCEAVVITHGGGSVCGIWHDGFFCFEPDRKVLAESVIGAGDCFAAFFSVAIGHGFPVPEAAEIAWNAGAVYVQRRLNEPVCPAELGDSLVEPVDLANRNFKLVFTNGCFDILHEGHMRTLEFAKSKGDKLVVALNSDASVKRLKGEGRPICPLDQRMKVMSNLKMVDFVVSFDEDTPYELLKKIKPDVLVKGADYSTSEIVGVDLVSEVYRAPIVAGLSTTNLLAAVT